jgi:hypothetical protein
VIGLDGLLDMVEHSGKGRVAAVYGLDAPRPSACGQFDGVEDFLHLLFDDLVISLDVKVSRNGVKIRTLGDGAARRFATTLYSHRPAGGPRGSGDGERPTTHTFASH